MAVCDADAVESIAVILELLRLLPYQIRYALLVCGVITLSAVAGCSVVLWSMR